MRPLRTERPARRRRRLLAPLAGAALLAVAIAERLRRKRKTSEGSVRMLEANKAISRRLVEEAFNDGRLEVVDELIAPTFVNHDPSVTGDMVGPEGTKQLIEGYRTAFPDLRITVEDQLAEGDRVATRWTATGTHQAELLGIAATGKQATITGLTIDRIEDGKIVESWNNWDTLGMLQQLGVVPVMTEA
jgi:steroid delta-isomerase-like uncharacterized protein